MTIRLYDLCGANDLRFSPYCARAKMALAIKGLAYETVPVPFTAIAEIGHGAVRAVPVLEDDDGRLVGDSFAIAEHLDEHHSGRPLFAGPPGRAAARFVEGTMNLTVHGKAMLVIAFDIHEGLQPVDKSYFRSSRESRLGKSLEAIHADRAIHLDELKKSLSPLRHVLKDRPFLGGEAPLFVDAIAFGSLHWIQAFGTVDLTSTDPVIGPWYQRCRAITFGAAAG